MINKSVRKVIWYKSGQGTKIACHIRNTDGQET